MIKIKEICVESDTVKFFDVIKILISSPHAVNKKIGGCTIEKCGKIQGIHLKDMIGNASEIRLNDQSQFWQHTEVVDPKLWKEFQPDSASTGGCLLVLSKILPKRIHKMKHFQTLSIIDYPNKTFYCLRYGNSNEQGLLPTFPYKIQYNGHVLSIHADLGVHGINYNPYAKACEWLSNSVMEKLQKFMTQKSNSNDNNKVVGTLSLVDLEEYTEFYAELKQKYTKQLFEIWSDESTDPKKFIFEDIAIAAYLILLWRKYNIKPQRFVDVGCGNGLLVHLLSEEGHFGLGIDLRKRKIWDKFPGTATHLTVRTIVPSDEALFPDVDWIIGNHSDELSPWIPVIAAKSSYTAKFFLLPCCAFEFNGSKYQRKNTKKSVYEDFLVYIQEISEVCGFVTQIDRLKIPSTKRIAIIGTARTYEKSELKLYSQKIQNFIEEKQHLVVETADNTEWIHDFKPREAIEKISNSTDLNKFDQISIVLAIFNELLTKRRFLPEFPNWNIGGTLLIKDAIKLLNDAQRKLLKAANGGLQTVLKNNHNVFQVQQGLIQIRKPLTIQEKSQENVQNEITYKVKNCWFKTYHPSGCPLSDSDCTYKH